MKIIGKMSSDGYMVSMSDHEIRRAAGYSDYEKLPPSQYETDRYDGRGGSWRLGTEIQFVEPTTKLRRLYEQEAKVRQSAAMLRGLADMMEALEPSKIILPDEPEAPAVL